ncbi:hypothetical protein HDA36_003936 [Nocardiopsis composta]|uniref:Uncharacterized protein n=1 Tax=Nocardiopsis composta TaxID=157465 RepID=A0A7W8QNS5_9ACTN|nr:hypothetical protein [Nocardiopsis composta]
MVPSPPPRRAGGTPRPALFDLHPSGRLRRRDSPTLWTTCGRSPWTTRGRTPRRRSGRGAPGGAGGFAAASIPSPPAGTPPRGLCCGRPAGASQGRPGGDGPPVRRRRTAHRSAPGRAGRCGGPPSGGPPTGPFHAIGRAAWSSLRTASPRSARRPNAPSAARCRFTCPPAALRPPPATPVETARTLPPRLRHPPARGRGRGPETAAHRASTAAADVPPCFCDPAGPRRRGSGESTGSLPRQHFPEGAGPSARFREELAAAAAEPGSRPRKTPGRKAPAGCPPETSADGRPECPTAGRAEQRPEARRRRDR